MNENVVLYTESGGVGTITINRPKAMNSLNADVFKALLLLARELRTNQSVKCVVLTAAGEKAFSAGNDVKGGGFTSKKDAQQPLLQVDTITALDALPQP